MARLSVLGYAPYFQNFSIVHEKGMKALVATVTASS